MLWPVSARAVIMSLIRGRALSLPWPPLSSCAP
jgi:hypothetical protein